MFVSAEAVPTEEISDDDTYYPSMVQIEAAKKNPLFAKLTEAQMRVFAELITGATEIQIAQRLNLAKSTSTITPRASTRPWESIRGQN